MKKSFTDHHYRLMLNRKLYLATIRLQADLSLGHSFSAMLPFITGLHAMGYLNDADFEVYKARYSLSLEEEMNVPSRMRSERRKLCIIKIVS